MKLTSTPGSTLLTAAYNLQNGGQYGEVTDNPHWKIPARSGGREDNCGYSAGDRQPTMNWPVTKLGMVSVGV